MVVIGEDGEAIGLIICDCGPENWSILLGYVLPEHRRKGIYTALFYALRDKAQEQGNIFSILSGTYPTTWPPKQHSKRKVGQKNT
ncbi:GNAT family N-acetyltransferase [Sinorhizobium medicae]|uniref:GNAT family N-acetyltransferase n=1 Tax=Sinorhizobium medicae TaxID=110321 RepID=UPI001F23C6C6|nr:GNAT family N-acetyltransferase [Sinorhizobium medicae]WQO88548.1 GNAT family N-acetyltransferase [Sinorhizobium medicae]